MPTPRPLGVCEEAGNTKTRKREKPAMLMGQSIGVGSESPNFRKRKPARPEPYGSARYAPSPRSLVVVSVGKGIEGEFTVERQAGELDVESLTVPIGPGYAKLRPFGALLAAGCVGAYRVNTVSRFFVFV